MIKSWIRTVLDKSGLLKVIRAKQKAGRNKSYYSEEQSINTDSLTEARRIEHNLRMQIHIIEKCLVIDNQSIFNNHKMMFDMVAKLDELLQNDYKRDGHVVIESLSAIHGVIARCKSNKTDCTAIEKEVASFMSRHHIPSRGSDDNAIEIVRSEPVAPHVLKQYKEVVESRVSIRKYKPDLVDRDTILEVIGVANLCPSACNRQPCKVYFSVNRDRQNELKELCGDRLAASNISNFMVSTVDKSAFSPNEPFQAWINGGIFVDALVNAIHAHGLGACIFQFSKYYKNLPKLKSLLGIPPYEDVICMIGFGYYTESTHHIKKHRKPIDEIAVER